MPLVVAAGPNGTALTRDEGRTWAILDTLSYWTIGFASPRAGWAAGTLGRVTRLGGW